MSREHEASEQNIERERESSELRCYRAIESECLKWEAKEARLIAQLEVRNTCNVTREIAGVPLVTTSSTAAASITGWGELVSSQVSSALQL